jgi:AcrR family transcriptional regulator
MTESTVGDRTPASQRTMAKFLEAAESIFGRHGYEGTSVREIASRAGVNLGTLKHYWGSKRDLFRDLMERRLRPIYDDAAMRLAALDPANTKIAPRADAVVACLVEPAFLIGVKSPPDLDFRDPRARGRFHLFFGRCLTDPAPEIVEDTNAMFNDVSRKFFELMRLASPKLSPAELDWRINCIFGTISFAQIYAERIGGLIGNEADVDDALAARWVMHFIEHGVGSGPMPMTIPTNLVRRPQAGTPARAAKTKRIRSK